MAPIAVFDAPSNLGLRMPSPGVVPGCYKLAGALRDQGLARRLASRDAGVVVPPRYDMHDWVPGNGVFNAEALAAYTPRLSSRVGELVDGGEFALVLGGDCSILLGTTLALRQRGRYGLAFIDGHSDFRHVGDVDANVGAAAGEDLALATGRGQSDLTDIDGLGPYVRDDDVVVLGIRDGDAYLDELRCLDIAVRTSSQIQFAGAATTGSEAVTRMRDLDGFWVHLDADVLDAEVMPAVDSPDPGGLDHHDLVQLLRPLVRDRACIGLEVTVYDPDLDQDGLHAVALTDTLVSALTDPSPVHSASR